MPRIGVMVVVGLFAALATAGAILRPPWEANDEPDHVRNVETIGFTGPAIGLTATLAAAKQNILDVWY